MDSSSMVSAVCLGEPGVDIPAHQRLIHQSGQGFKVSVCRPRQLMSKFRRGSKSERF